MQLDELAAALADEMGAEYELEDDGTYTLAVPADDDSESLVSVYLETLEEGPAEGSEVLVIRAATEGRDGPAPTGVLGTLMAQASGEIGGFDPRGLLDDAAACWFTRVYLEDEPTRAVAEAALPFDGLQREHACHALAEVVDLAEGWRGIEPDDFDNDDEQADEDPAAGAAEDD